MEPCTLALFGESEKGEFEHPYFLQEISQLVECLGNPPPNTKGVFLATQALMYHYNLLFFRVKEEGFSFPDYLTGIHQLEIQDLVRHITALCLPGVGNSAIIEAATPFCISHRSLIIITETDLYDFLTT